MESNIEGLRDRLRHFLDYDEAVKIRKQLRAYAIENYKHKYSNTERMGFVIRNELSTRVMGAQQENFPYYYELFSIVTQHIRADTIEELLDMAIDIEKTKNN